MGELAAMWLVFAIVFERLHPGRIDDLLGKIA